MKILHGPYGAIWAWEVDLGPGCFSRGWHRADDEAAAIEAAKAEIVRWQQRPEEATIDRVDPPLRPPKCGSPNANEGEYQTDGEWVETNAAGEPSDDHLPFGGACPVQGDGTIDGYNAYYRARGTGWTVDINLSENECWTYGEHVYAWPDGGWIHRDESIANIERAVAAFRARFVAQKPE